MRKPFIALLLLLPMAAIAAEPCHYSAQRNSDMPAGNLKQLALTLGSADLDIRGVQGLNRIEVRGTACASNQSWLKDLQVTGSSHGDSATVIAQNNHEGGISGLFGSSYAYLKLQVRVPASMRVDVRSGSGDTQAHALAALNLHSGSGDLAADGIAGALTLQLGSGDVRANHVGSVELRRTGSGDVGVDGVNGDVRVGQSGSGDLAFRDVTGGVKVESTGSGDITLDRIGRSVVIGSIGSGDVNADGIGGDFTVQSSGSGDIIHHHVKGKVSVPQRDDD